jgi:hypothetical protein
MTVGEMMVGEVIGGHRGAPGLGVALNLLNLEFRKYQELKARDALATVER